MKQKIVPVSDKKKSGNTNVAQVSAVGKRDKEIVTAQNRFEAGNCTYKGQRKWI